MKRLFNKLKQFSRAQAGIAFVEFAVTLPFLLALFLGSVEVTRYILIVQKVEKVSATIADLVAQEQTVTNSELNTIILAASQVMQPYTFSSNAYVIISSVTQSGSNAPKVNWQYTGGGTWTHMSQIGTANNTATLPAGFDMTGEENVIFTEVYYQYQPMLTSVVGNVMSTTNLYKVAVFKPRLGDLSTLGS